MLTVICTYLNFFETCKSPNGKQVTPAMRLGLADKFFTVVGIIYFL